jgi:hypothetical protein
MVAGELIESRRSYTSGSFGKIARARLGRAAEAAVLGIMDAPAGRRG